MRYVDFCFKKRFVKRKQFGIYFFFISYFFLTAWDGSYLILNGTISRFKKNFDDFPRVCTSRTCI